MRYLEDRVKELEEALEVRVDELFEEAKRKVRARNIRTAKILAEYAVKTEEASYLADMLAQIYGVRKEYEEYRKAYILDGEEAVGDEECS